MLAVCSKVLAAGAEGPLREEKLGLPHGRHSSSPFQGTPEGTAEPLKQLMAPREKRVRDKAENDRQAEEDRTERVRSSRENTTVSEGHAPCARAGIPLQHEFKCCLLHTS